jgi:hypothetical protein
MSDETLLDRITGPSSYWLEGIGVVQVVPPGGTRWTFPADEPYAFERKPDSGRLTAADVRNWNAPASPLLPPSDVRGGAFSCCAGCADTPKITRCSGCPRGNFRLNVRRRTEPTSEPRPRRHWWPWRKD